MLFAPGSPARPSIPINKKPNMVGKPGETGQNFKEEARTINVFLVVPKAHFSSCYFLFQTKWTTLSWRTSCRSWNPKFQPSQPSRPNKSGDKPRRLHQQQLVWRFQPQFRQKQAKLTMYSYEQSAQQWKPLQTHQTNQLSGCFAEFNWVPVHGFQICHSGLSSLRL